MMDKNKSRTLEKDSKNIEKNKPYNKKLFIDTEERERAINEIMGLEE